jgi:iron complex transport system substrate-binding protein
MPRPRRPRVRSLLCALAAGATALALAACGNDADAGHGDTRTITDAQGTEVEVPVLPQRVVALSEPTLDGALAVGLRPVATTAAHGSNDVASYMTMQARGVLTVGPFGRPNLDHVTALEPDLILLDATSALGDAAVRRLRRIAPTVHVTRAGQDWRTAFTTEADALNRQKEAAHVLHEFDARVAQVRGTLGAHAGARVGVTPAPPSGASAVDDVLADLGLTRAHDPRDADWRFTDAGATKAKAEREDHVRTVDASAWTGAGGPIAEREVVDDVARALGR